MARDRARKEKLQQQQQRGAYADAPEVEYYVEEEEEEEVTYGGEEAGSGGGREQTPAQARQVEEEQQLEEEEEEEEEEQTEQEVAEVTPTRSDEAHPGDLDYANGHGHAPGHHSTPMSLARQDTQRAPPTARAQGQLASPVSPPFGAQEVTEADFFPACFVQLPPNNKVGGRLSLGALHFD